MRPEMRQGYQTRLPPSRALLVLLASLVGLVAGCSAAFRSATPIERRTAIASAADGTEIYYEVSGSGPAVVLIHGLGGNHAVWFQQVPALARQYTVVTLSQRGFAPSGGPRDRYDVAVLVADLVAVMDAARVPRAHVVGQSMGGWTALGLALRHPERVSSLVLADTVAGISDPAIAAHHASMIERARRIAAAPPPLGVHPALDGEFSAREPDRAYLYQALASFGAPSAGEIAEQLAAATFDQASLATNRVPALFIVGERDPVFPVTIVERAAAELARSRVIVMPGAGHSPYFEQPRAWNRIVTRFFEESPEHPGRAARR